MTSFLTIKCTLFKMITLKVDVGLIEMGGQIANCRYSYIETILRCYNVKIHVVSLDHYVDQDLLVGFL